MRIRCTERDFSEGELLELACRADELVTRHDAGTWPVPALLRGEAQAVRDALAATLPPLRLLQQRYRPYVERAALGKAA